MKNSKTKILLPLVGASLVVTALTGCGPKLIDTLTVCLASEPASIDPALNSAVDGATLLVHLDSGLYRYVKEGDKVVLKYDLAKEITKTTTSVTDIVLEEDPHNEGHYIQNPVVYPEGTRYTVTLRDDIKWSNGNPITADDFIWSWNRAAGATLGGDYCYMFEQICNGTAIETCDDPSLGGVSSLGIQKVNDRQFTIDVMVDVPFFNQLLAFPTYFPVNKATVEANDTETDGKWATDPSTYVSCGAYKLTQWVHDSYLLLEKNPDYWNANEIKVPKIKFALSDDATAMLASYNAGEYNLIDDVPVESIDTLKRTKPNEFKIDGQMGTYYISFNMNSTKFDAVATTEAKKASVRKALGLFVARQYIIDNVAKGGQLAANAFVSKGLSDAAGGEFVDHNGPNHDGNGYFKKGETDAEYAQNVAEAIQILKDVGYTYDETTHKFTNFPAFTFLYNTGSGHKAIAENIRDTLNEYGITMNLAEQAWAQFLETRKNGEYDVARNGWIADYDDPSSYLTMWTTNSGNNDSQFGRANHGTQAIYSADVNRDGTKETGLTWAQSYDVLIDKSNKESDAAKRFQILHEAEDLLMETGAICPIYYYTDLYLINSDIHGFFSTPLGYKFFMYCTR